MQSKEEYWQQHVSAWQESALSQAKYCKQHQLHENQFSYWKCKLTRVKAAKLTTPGFAVAQIEITEEVIPSALCLTLPNGVVISGIDLSNYAIALKLMEGC